MNNQKENLSQNLHLKYSVEFVNTSSHHTTLDRNHLDCGDLDTINTNENSLAEQNYIEGKNNERKIEIAVAIKGF